MSATHRIEQDSLGPVDVPSSALWGASTQRAIDNFPLNGITIGTHRNLIRALAEVKEAAATANAELGTLPTDKATAIIGAGTVKRAV